jgi:hypothetical protein
LARGDTGIVNQDIESRKSAVAFKDQFTAVLTKTYIGLADFNLDRLSSPARLVSAGLAGRLCGRVVYGKVDQQIKSGGRELQRNPTADASGTTGDQRDWIHLGGRIVSLRLRKSNFCPCDGVASNL